MIREASYARSRSWRKPLPVPAGVYGICRASWRRHFEHTP
jgi:hypothetical protein